MHCQPRMSHDHSPTTPVAFADICHRRPLACLPLLPVVRGQTPIPFCQCGTFLLHGLSVSGADTTLRRCSGLWTNTHRCRPPESFLSSSIEESLEDEGGLAESRVSLHNDCLPPPTHSFRALRLLLPHLSSVLLVVPQPHLAHSPSVAIVLASDRPFGFVGPRCT